jgi:hypothetical protein
VGILVYEIFRITYSSHVSVGILVYEIFRITYSKHVSVGILIYERFRITYSLHVSFGIFPGTPVSPLPQQYTSVPLQTDALLQLHPSGQASAHWLYSTEDRTDTQTINPNMTVSGQRQTPRYIECRHYKSNIFLV